MDDDVAEEITFSTLFPLPFRVLFLGGLGILGWATNLHGLNALGIDAVAALELNTQHQSQRLTISDYSATETSLPTTRAGWKFVADPSTTYTPVYRLFAQYTIVALVGWLLYRHASHGDVELVDVYKFVPAVTMLVWLMLLVAPYDIAEKKERDKFIQYVSIVRCFDAPLGPRYSQSARSSIYRCLFARTRIFFSDVVFADIFTSFAKVLGDVWLSCCMLLPGGSLLLPPGQQGYARWILPTIMRYVPSAWPVSLVRSHVVTAVYHTRYDSASASWNISSRQTAQKGHFITQSNTPLHSQLFIYLLPRGSL